MKKSVNTLLPFLVTPALALADNNFKIINNHQPMNFFGNMLNDGDYIKQDMIYQVKTSISDPETDIDDVFFSWVGCNEHNLEKRTKLSLIDNAYTGDTVFTSFTDGQRVCFSFSSNYNGDESIISKGMFIVNNVPPNLTLVSPSDKAAVGIGSKFSFRAVDNTDSVMQCSIYIDGVEYRKDIAAKSMQIVSVENSEMDEGEHSWSIECEYIAGWTSYSNTWTYLLDKTPPTIVMTTPENNKIIADSTYLEFEVTDNNGISDVYFVRDGNETLVDSIFKINISDWNDGPNEFAVRAADSFDNQAEQTNRIRIDKSPPQIVLSNPDNNSTSDIHVNLNYSVLDNYDNDMDCKVYVDNKRLQQHKARQDASIIWPAEMAKGGHRWSVQCVDNTGNVGQSDERDIFIVDSSGPDITFSVPDKVFRGDLVKVSLNVDDISGVSKVIAELRNHHDYFQSIPLKIGEAYTAEIETTVDWKDGAYTLEVYAVDTLNFFSYTEYNITMEVKNDVGVREEQSDIEVGIPLHKSEECEVATVTKDKRTTIGIGKAYGFMKGLDIGLGKVFLVLALMSMLLGTLHRFGWSKDDNKKNPAAVDVLSCSSDSLSIDSYMENRNKRRNK
ncbi:hypothetical protein HQ545_00760 [Candidatus Woesearchaeota archaeon]|nr:hypothetical protein [Candidatus Woesearchaeota archaeon]